MTGLEEVAADWGIQVPRGQVYQRLRQYAIWTDAVLVSSANPLHPVTRDFRDDFVLEGRFSRPLRPESKGDFASEFLAETEEKPLSFVDANGNRALDEDETRGRIVIAATVYKPRPDDPPPEFKIQNTRLAVFGDSTYFRNGAFRRFSHKDLVLNTVRWLLGLEEELAGATGSPWKERILSRSEGIHRFLFWVPIFVFPGIVLCVGVFVFFLRKS